MASPSCDPNVATLLDLDPACIVTVTPFGHGTSSASTAKISARSPDGKERLFFLKALAGAEAALTVEGCALTHPRP